MKVTLAKWEKDTTTGALKIRHEIVALGATAKECMKTVNYLREHNDLARFTPWEVENIED